MNGAYQIINFDDIEFTTGTAELVVGAYKKITDTAKRFVITHLNLDDETYKDIQLTFENVEGTFVGTGVVNGKLAVVSIASTDQVTVSLNDIAGGITALQNALAVTDAKFNYSTTESVIGTWVDGRPLYRKVFEITSDFTDPILVDNNADMCLIDGIQIQSDATTQFGYYFAIEGQMTLENLGNYIYMAYFKISDHSLHPQLGSKVISDSIKLIWILTYTKSTDLPPTP